MRNWGLCVWVLFMVFSLPLPALTATADQETITLSTYYPAPYGVYNQLRAKKLAVGENYFDKNNYNDWGVSTNNDVDLVVEGDVIIGTDTVHSPSPTNRQPGNLDVNDVYIRATNGWVSQMRGGAPEVDSYTGDGTSEQTIAFGFKPSAVIITMQNDLQITKTQSMANWSAFQQGAGNTGEGKAHFEDSTKLVNIGFQVKGWANKSGKKYHYIAWP